MPEFIVGEVSKNWQRAQYVGLVPPAALISGMFEKMIEHNARRGYVLHSWQLHRVMVDADNMNETIIAVFRQGRPTEPKDPGSNPAGCTLQGS